MNVQAVRNDFPILDRLFDGRPLIYLDSAATSQKPRAVVSALVEYYENYNANVHRAVYQIGEEATQAYEGTRGKVARFIGTEDTGEVIFTRNTTESINLVAQTWGRANLRDGDEILLTPMEHHSNLIPWQMIAAEKGAKLRFLELNADGTLDLSGLETLLTPRTKLLAFTQMSNVLGTILPTRDLADAAHAVGAVVLVDAAQSAPHMAINVADLGADFLAFSSHKMLGPTGVGVLWGKRALLEAMPPFLGGGDMIRQVWLDRATWNALPWKFEAGTPNIGDVVGFGAALDYLQALGMDEVRRHEVEITAYAMEVLSRIEGLIIYGPTDPQARGGLVSFNMEDVHPHDLATLLDRDHICVRAGHHCCQPLMRLLEVSATARASFYIYNTPEEVDALAASLLRAREVFSRVAV